MMMGDDIWSCGDQPVFTITNYYGVGRRHLVMWRPTVLMYYGLHTSNVNDVKDDNEASGSKCY